MDTGNVDTEGSEDGLDMNTDLIDAPLLRHARDIYMSNIFFMFRAEYKKSEYLFVHTDNGTCDHRGLVFDCEVRMPRHSRHHKVHAEPTDGRVNCSCKGFENTGILCSHALTVLDCLFIERIPAQYILEKFMKNPGVGMVEDIHGQKYAKLGRFIRFKTLHSMFERLANVAAKSDEGQRIFVEHIDKLQIMMGDMSDKESPCETDETSMITCERERTRDMNDLGITNATEDKGMKKAMGLNCDQVFMKCNDEKLEAKRGQSTTVGGTTLSSSSPSTHHRSQPTNGFLELAHSNSEAIDLNKKPFYHNKNR